MSPWASVGIVVLGIAVGVVIGFVITMIYIGRGMRQ